MRKAGLVILGCVVTVAACGGSSPPPATVASLPIMGYSLHTVTLKPKLARVAAGHEFSVVADATDGPMVWRLTSAACPPSSKQREVHRSARAGTRRKRDARCPCGTRS